MTTQDSLVTEIEAMLRSKQGARQWRMRPGDPTRWAVWDLLRPPLLAAPADQDGRRCLSKTDLLKISNTIDKEYVSHALRWHFKTTLNDLMAALASKNMVRPLYLNIPQQIPRSTIVSFDGVSPETIRLVLKLRARLDRRDIPRPDNTWTYAPGIWEFFLLYMSLVLSSHVLIPKLYAHLLHENKIDTRTPGWIRIQRERYSGFPAQHTCFYPLTPQTSRFLRRFKRVRAQVTPQHGSAGLGRPTWAQEMRSHKGLWRAWRALLTQLLGETTLPRALLRWNNLPDLGRIVALIEGMPPFLIAMAAYEPDVEIDPMTIRSFKRLVLNRRRAPSWPTRLPPPPRRRGPEPVPATYSHMRFDRIEEIRKTLDRTTSRTYRLPLADDLDRLLGHRPASASTMASSLEILNYNAWCYGAWVVSLLRGRDRSGTVLTRSSAIAASFFPVFLTRALSAWNEDDWVNAVLHALQGHTSPSVKFAYRRFLDFLVSMNLTPMQTIDWHNPALRRPIQRQPVPLIGFDEFERALDACAREGIPCKLHALLRVKLILGFFAGLRSMEASQLRLRELIVDPEPIVQVTKAKTEQGIRNLYLTRLMPAPYVREVLSFRQVRLQEARGHLDAPLLGTGSHPKPFDSSYLASLAGVALRRAVQEPVCFHHLRHAFASWILIRLLAATKPGCLDPTRFPFAPHDVFSPTSLKRLQTLVFGFNPPKIGQSFTSHSLVVLCRLLGHSSPITSLTYCHSAEILLRMCQLNRVTLQSVSASIKRTSCVP